MPEIDQCLNCTLPICDQDKGKPCRYTEDGWAYHERIKESKRESNKRVRDMRRIRADRMLTTYKQALNMYVNDGKHRQELANIDAYIRGERSEI
jgi:hypothetical protein